MTKSWVCLIPAHPQLLIAPHLSGKRLKYLLTLRHIIVTIISLSLHHCQKKKRGKMLQREKKNRIRKNTHSRIACSRKFILKNLFGKIICVLESLF